MSTDPETLAIFNQELKARNHKLLDQVASEHQADVEQYLLEVLETQEKLDGKIQ